MSQQAKTPQIETSTIEVLGQLVVIIDVTRNGETVRDWIMPDATPAQAMAVEQYLIDEGYFADWFGEDAVRQIVDQARRDGDEEVA